MTLRDMFPEWLCKVTLSFPETCSEKSNWLDFTIYEFIFTLVILLIIKRIIYHLFYILNQNKPEKEIDSTIISPSLLYKEMDLTDDEIEDIKDQDMKFDSDIISLEEESMILTKKEDNSVENIDKEVETSILNITKK